MALRRISVVIKSTEGDVVSLEPFPWPVWTVVEVVPLIFIRLKAGRGKNGRWYAEIGPDKPTLENDFFRPIAVLQT
jgi:hypothetical protein